MKKEKSQSLICLTRLYFSYLFQKATIIVFSISLILILGIVILISNPFYNNHDYLYNANEIHTLFLSQSLFVIQLFNSIIITTVALSLTINSNSFDSLFLSHTSRLKICISKLLACMFVLIFLNIYEVLLLVLVPLIRYPLYKISNQTILYFIYLYISTITETITSFLISTAIPIIIAPMIFMFLSIVIKLLSNNFTLFKDFASKIIPIINVNEKGITLDSLMVIPIWIILFSLLYLSIYYVKDLKQ